MPVPTSETSSSLETNATVTNTVGITCDKGYRFPDNETVHNVTCSPNYKWTGMLPFCEGKKQITVKIAKSGKMNLGWLFYNIFGENYFILLMYI